MNEPLRILLIDDDPDDRTLIARELKKAYKIVKITQIGTKEEFQRTIEKWDYDIVITDYNLQWSDGLEVIKILKRDHPKIPIIMVTGCGNDEVAQKAFQQGSDDYIEKSILHYKVLYRSINRVFKRLDEIKAS